MSEREDRLAHHGTNNGYAHSRRLFLGLLVGAAMCGRVRAAESYDAVVGGAHIPGALPSLGAALAKAQQSSAARFRILLTNGEWTEKLIISRPGVEIIGQSQDAVIRFSAAAGHMRPDGSGRWGTSGSATLTVDADDVRLTGLTIRNGFDYLTDRITGASGGAQAVALMLGAGDRFRVRDCTIEGYQDTLYVRSGRALFENCRIAGGTDFIFGGATALFDRCEIISRAVPGAAIQGYVVAPSTPAVQPVGLVFSRCRLVREAGVPDRSVYLGRPWRAGGNMALTGHAAFIDCWMDAHIRPEGWSSMGFTDPAGVRRQLTPQEARLFEFDSRGPGAGQPNATRRFLTADEARSLVDESIFGDWRPRS